MDFVHSACSDVVMYTMHWFVSVFDGALHRIQPAKPCPPPTKHCAIIKNVVLAPVSAFRSLRVETHIASNNLR